MLRLPKFQVALPESVADAVALLSAHEGEAMIVAGGTDLLPNLKHRLFEPKLLVSLERVAGLGAIQREADGTLRIGAMARLDQLAAHADVIAHAPALAQAHAAWCRAAAPAHGHRGRQRDARHPLPLLQPDVLLAEEPRLLSQEGRNRVPRGHAAVASASPRPATIRRPP